MQQRAEIPLKCYALTLHGATRQHRKAHLRWVLLIESKPQEVVDPYRCFLGTLYPQLLELRFGNKHHFSATGILPGQECKLQSADQLEKRNTRHTAPLEV